MLTGETAWNPTGVGKVSLCAGLHGGRWSHRVVEVFQDLCMSTITSVCRQNVWSSDLLCNLGQKTELLEFFKTFA